MLLVLDGFFENVQAIEDQKEAEMLMDVVGSFAGSLFIYLLFIYLF
jgi:hypothetical protein